MPMIDVGDCHLNVRVDGPKTGRCVMFSNSLGTDLRIWDPLLALMPEDLRIIRYDKRGHGLSDCPGGPYSIEMLASDAAAIADAVDARDVTVIGLSIGGLIGQVLADTRPDLIRALVLMDTATKIGTSQLWDERIAGIKAVGMDGIADGVMERWFCAEMRADTGRLAYWKNMLIRTPQAGYIACCEAIGAADFRQNALSLPMLAMAGDQDNATPPELVAATAKHYGAPFVPIKNAGHLPCVEQPAEVATVLGEFLRETNDV